MSRVVPFRIEPSTVDGQILQTVNGVAVWATLSAGAATTVLVPWTTTVGGTPENVYDQDDQLVLSEDPL